MSKDYFVNKYLGLNKRQQHQVDMDVRAVEGVLGIPEGQGSKLALTELTNMQAVQEVEAAVLSGNEEAIKELQMLYGTPDVDAAQTQIVNKMADEDEDKYAVAEMLRNKTIIARRSAELIEEAHSEMLDASEDFANDPMTGEVIEGKIDPLESYVNRVIRSGAELIDSAIPFMYLKTVEKYFIENDPDYQPGSSVFLPDEAFQRIQDRLGGMTAEEFEKHGPRLKEYLRANSGTIMKGNNYLEYMSLMNDAFGALARGEQQGNLNNILNPVIAVADAIGLGSAIKAGGRAIAGGPAKQITRGIANEPKVPIFLNEERVAKLMNPASDLSEEGKKLRDTVRGVFGDDATRDITGFLRAAGEGGEAVAPARPLSKKARKRAEQALARGEKLPLRKRRGMFETRRAEYVANGTGVPAFAKMLARTKQGARTLIDANSAKLAALGTDKGAVVSELLVPKLAAKEPSPIMQLDELYFKPEDRKAMAKRLEEDKQGIFQQRLKDTSIIEEQHGMRVFSYLGHPTGRSFPTIEDAISVSKDLDVPSRVVEDGAGKYLIRTEESVPYTLKDAGIFKDEVKQWGQGRGFGRSAKFGEYLNYVLGQAEVLGAKATANVQKMLKSYNSLSGKNREAANQLIEEHDRLGASFKSDTTTLRNRGFTKEQIAGYKAFRSVDDRLWAKKNANTRSTLIAEDFRATKIPGQGLAIVKRATLTELDEAVSRNANLIDGTTGELVKAKTAIGEGGNFFQLADPLKGNVEFVFYHSNAKVILEDLPPVVIKKKPGHLGRYYNAPWLIRIRNAEGVMETRYTAGDEAAGGKWVENYKAAHGLTENDVELVRSLETMGAPESFDDLARIRADGRLVTSRRKDDPLQDIEGVSRMVGVEDAIARTAGSLVTQESYGPMIAAVAQRFNNTYGKALGWRFNLSRRPQLSGKAHLADLEREAIAIHDHMLLVGGLHKNQQAWQGVKNLAAELFYKGRKLPGVGKTLEGVGQNIQGIRSDMLQNAKNTAFVTYLALNPVVQGMLQMSMVPTYLATKGGSKYLRSGQMHRDFLGILHSDDPAQLKVLAKASGMKEADYLRKIKAFRESGMMEMVDTHLWQASLLQESRVGSRSRYWQSAESVVNAFKKVGFDVGIKVDKTIAWLVSYEDALLSTGKKVLSNEDLRKVGIRAEALTGNINRSDPLFHSDGIISAWLQFASHGIKMLNRTAGAVTSGRVGSETFISVADQQRMVTGAMLTYGVNGFKIAGAVEYLNRAYFDGNLPDDAKLALEEGMLGALYNYAMNAGLDPEERVQWSFSGRLSPYTAVGPAGNAAKVLFKNALALFTSDDVDFNELFNGPMPNAAALGFVGDMASVLNFARTLGMYTDETFGDVALATAEEFFRKVPITSNAMKAIMVYNTGNLIDGKGTPISEVNRRGAISAILGITNTKETDAYRKLVTEMYDVYSGMSDDSVNKVVDKEAKATADWMIRYLRRLPDGEINRAEAEALVREHSIAWTSALTPDQMKRYRSAVLKRIQKSDVMRDDRLAESILRDVNRGNVSAITTRDKFAQSLGAIPQFDKYMKELDRQAGIAENLDAN